MDIGKFDVLAGHFSKPLTYAIRFAMVCEGPDLFHVERVDTQTILSAERSALTDIQNAETQKQRGREGTLGGNHTRPRNALNP